MTAPIASGWSGCRVGLAPTGKRRLCTAHTQVGHRSMSGKYRQTQTSSYKAQSDAQRKSRPEAAINSILMIADAEQQNGYFNEVLIELNMVFRLPPSPLTTAMIASAIPAAISPYSMAVAPDSSFQKLKKERVM
jgi:hypothetical protein